MSKNLQGHFYAKKPAALMSLWGLCFLLLLSACMPSPNSNRRNANRQNASTDTPPPVGTPIFTNDTNYFQDGTTKATTVFDQSVFSSDTYYLRGKNVNLFIKAGNTTSVQCLVH